MAGEPAQYKSLEDLGEITKLISHAMESEAKVRLVFEGVEKKFESRITHPNKADKGKKIAVIAPAGFKPESILNPAAKLLVFLEGQVVLGFQAEMVGEADPYILFTYPKKLMKIQRRKSVRLPILGGYDIQVQLDSLEIRGKRIRRKLLDVSASGLGFHVLSSREAGLWRKGLIVKNVQFQLGARKFVIDGQISTQIELKDPRTQGFKIGLNFLRIKKDDAEWINDYVYNKLAYLLF